MALLKDDGTRLTQATFLGGTYTSDASETKRTVLKEVWEEFYPDGATVTKSRRLKYKVGEVISQEDVDALYAEATITAITPDTGSTDGGTAVVITGTNLTDATGVTFGGTAGTAFSVVSDTTIHVTTPAHAAAAVDVVVTTDAGSVTEAGGFTYA